MEKHQFREERNLDVLGQFEARRKIADVCREHGISDATYHRWKAKYVGLEARCWRASSRVYGCGALLPLVKLVPAVCLPSIGSG